MQNSSKPGILCVANWKSDVGYAWWLMESYWVVISEVYKNQYQTWLSYPEVNEIPESIQQSDIRYFEHSFRPQNLRDIFRNIEVIKKYNIEVLYLSDYGVSALSYALYRLAGVKKIIIHDHTPGLRSRARGWRRLLKIIKANFPLCSVDAGFGATDFVSTRLKETACLSTAKVYTVKNGIPLNSKALTSEHQNLLSELGNKKIIVTAARANKYKGLLFAIEVIAELVNSSSHKNLIYLFCGDGPDLELAKDYAVKLGVDSYCHFPGRVNDVQALFSNCHIGFQPSQGEVGYSLSILEYMLAELPVIVPDNHSVCEATGHEKTGLVYKEHDVENAAKCIAKYLNNELMREKHGQSARESIEQTYSLANTHEALKAALSKVI